MIGIIKNNKGISLLEVIVTVTLLSLVIVCTLSLFSTSLNLWADGSSHTSANMYASIATRKLVLQIEEGRSASVTNGKLSVTFPYKASATSDYNVNQTGVTYNFYQSGPNGTETTGTYIWRSTGTTGTNKVMLSRNIKTFSPSIDHDKPKLIRITIIGEDNVGKLERPYMINQSIKLRNG